MNNDEGKKELEVNRQKREDYEKLMKESSTNLDGYWDKNSIVVKIILFVLLAIIVVGSTIIILSYFTSK